MEQRRFLYKSKAIHYLAKGRGPVIVLLHGFGEDGRIWKRQYDAFPNNRLLVPDLPGSGLSEPVEDMSMEGLARVVQALLAEEDSSTCILIGHSMGGYITLAFAALFGDQLDSFGLFHSSAFPDSEEKRETRRKGIEFIRRNGASAFLKTSIPNLYSAASREAHPEWVEEHLSENSNFSDASLITYYESMMQRPDRTAVLREARVPVLFVMGREDAAVPLEDGLRQCHLPRVSQVCLLERSGHMGMIEEADKATECLTTFVNCSIKP